MRLLPDDKINPIGPDFIKNATAAPGLFIVITGVISQVGGCREPQGAHCRSHMSAPARKRTWAPRQGFRLLAQHTAGFESHRVFFWMLPCCFAVRKSCVRPVWSLKQIKNHQHCSPVNRRFAGDGSKFPWRAQKMAIASLIRKLRVSV